jgi:acetylornithine/N-succinyldiaminopimelate aminotransferase
MSSRGAVTGPDPTALESEHLMTTYARLPVAFVRGSGTLLYDTQGKEYLDFLAGLAVVSLGHAHREVADAIADQARTLVHVSNLYHNELAEQLAARLDTLIGGGGRVFFANSGAEANECAIKLARLHGRRRGGPDRFEIVSALGSFHGRSLATLAATGQPDKHEAFQPLPEGFRHVAFGDIDALSNAVDTRVCAVLLESIQGEGGVHEAPAGYLESVKGLCEEREALLIIDEVQTGLGRTGEWFAFQHSGIHPDVVTIAKALGNGMPIGACWARDEVAAEFTPGLHGSTFGGQPLATRTALAVLDVMEREQVVVRARSLGMRLREGLAAVRGVRDTRGSGLLVASELERGIDARAVMISCLEAGLVVNAVTASAIRFAPPLLVSEEEIDRAVEIFARAIEEVSR